MYNYAIFFPVVTSEKTKTNKSLNLFGDFEITSIIFKFNSFQK